MNYLEFLTRVIDEGIAAAIEDYGADKHKRDGSVAGFEACRNKQPHELDELRRAASVATHDARCRKAQDYWWFRCYELEVEWVCNVVSVMLMNQGLPPVIVNPTCRGAMMAAGIIGVTDAKSH